MTARSREARRGLHRTRAVKLFAGALAFVAASAISVVEPAHAQGPQGQPGQGGAPAMPGAAPGGLNVDVASLLKAKAGAWADYTITGADGKGGAATVRYAIVDRSASKLALEVTSSLPKGELVLHLDFAPQGPDAWKVTAGRLQLGGQKQDLPSEQLSVAPPLRASDSLGVLVGTESLTTPLGALPCKHYKKSMPEVGLTLDVWANETVSPTGVVKSSIQPAGTPSKPLPSFAMMLLGTGNGATAKLP
jgi:hypothetical protein